MFALTFVLCRHAGGGRRAHASQRIRQVRQRSGAPMQSSWQNAPHFLHSTMARRLHAHESSALVTATAPPAPPALRHRPGPWTHETCSNYTTTIFYSTTSQIWTTTYTSIRNINFCTSKIDWCNITIVTRSLQFNAND